MRVSATTIAPSPAGYGRVRYAATIEYDTNASPPEILWFDVQTSAALELRPSGNPWLCALLTVAMMRGETLHIADGVDAQLLEGAHTIQHIWTGWDPTMKAIAIECPIIHDASPKQEPHVGSFFSGGIDSFHTVLYHDAHAGLLPRVDELITVWGFDIGVGNETEISIARKNIDSAAKALDRPRIEIWTNIRETRVEDYNWGRYTHGGALTAVAHMLAPRFTRVLIPGSYSTRNMYPWGSHAVTDPLWSSQNLHFTYDGVGFSRTQKIRFVKDYPVALNHVRTCWENRSAENCSACGKCVRVMTILASMGALDRCQAFDKSKFSIDLIRNTIAHDEQDIENYEIVMKDMAHDAPQELREALNECVTRNRQYYKRLRRFERLEWTPLVGWLFGRYKRAYVLDKSRH